MWCKTWTLSIILTCWISNIFSQENLLLRQVSINNSEILITQKDYLDYLSTEYGFIVSYNSNLLEVDRPVTLLKTNGSLETILREIFFQENLTILTLGPNKVVLHSKGSKKDKKLYSLSGHIYDQNSGEQINGAIIIEKHSNTSVISNENGYFILEIPKGSAILESRYLGYKTSNMAINLLNNIKHDVYLVNDNQLPIIIIEDDPKSRLNLSNSGEIIDVFKTQEYKSIIGEKDLLNNAKIQSGVQSGGEGQSGLFVRGGTPDQNLTLLEGVSLYETSHTAGISSIFIEESIKEASFIRSGFPARYSGRLSSVLDIQLKDGHKTKHQSLISVGVSGGKIHVNGPIKNNKTTYNFSARSSWLNYYVNNILKRYTKYDDINIAYTDVIGKVTHHFSPTQSLSLTLYSGSDKLELTKSDEIIDEDYKLRIFDKNALSWGNKMASVKWQSLLNDKTSLKIQTGILSYKNGSRSSYKFSNMFKDSINIDELDILSSSNIRDINFRADVEYFHSDKHVLRVGTNVIFHNFNPTVKQSLVILEGDIENIVDRDSLISATELHFYAEDNFKININLFLYGGINVSLFKVENKTHSSIQPRLKLIWSPNETHLFSGGFSRMSQFVHLLSNSGLGLPSELWVPSTAEIKPQNATQFTLNYSYNFVKGMQLNLSGYSKRYTNSLEYTSPIELFYFLINNQNIVPVFNTSRDWERNLFIGSTKSKGLEMLIHKKEGKIKGWLSTTYSKTEKSFPAILNGDFFPANQDRTWDINSGIIYSFSEPFSVGLNFVYGTGNTFSLATEEFDSFLGIKLLKSNGRNNYRLPPFHHLSLNASYTLKGKLFETQFNLNVYNVYNRLNAYYIYIYRNPEPPNDNYLRKVSILPFSPTFNISIKF